MLKGIEQAAAFVLFLSQGVLERPYCQLEIRHAMALKKPMVLLVRAKQMCISADHCYPTNPARERCQVRRL